MVNTREEKKIRLILGVPEGDKTNFLGLFSSAFITRTTVHFFPFYFFE
jgi:hypothetical protein